MGILENQLRSISELSEPIYILAKTEVLDDVGAIKETTAAAGTAIRAKVRYDRTNEGDLGVEQEKLTTEIKIWIRHGYSPSIENVILWNSKYYDIYAIEDTPGFRYDIIKARAITV